MGRSLWGIWQELAKQYLSFTRATGNGEKTRSSVTGTLLQLRWGVGVVFLGFGWGWWWWCCCCFVGVLWGFLHYSPRSASSASRADQPLGVVFETRPSASPGQEPPPLPFFRAVCPPEPEPPPRFSSPASGRPVPPRSAGAPLGKREGKRRPSAPALSFKTRSWSGGGRRTSPHTWRHRWRGVQPALRAASAAAPCAVLSATVREEVLLCPEHASLYLRYV